MEIDFLSACYGCRLFSPQKFLSFALLKHNPEIYLDRFQAPGGGGVLDPSLGIGVPPRV